jgi:D-inositol-3-phosphate glycosyltransferase
MENFLFRETMKTALLTLNIGNVLRDNSRASFQAAARRWNCDYIEVTEAHEGIHPHAMKLKAFDLCDADRVFYVDADAVISAGCPNPFETFPEDAFVAANNQQGHMTDSCRRACADVISQDLLKISAELQESPISHPQGFINSGMWLASRKAHLDILRKALEISILMYGKTSWRDQSALNYTILRNGIPVLEAPPTWNYQFPPDTGSRPMEKFIYHWAGGEDRDQIDGVNWRSFRAAKVESFNAKPKLLVIADHCLPTGFARVAENICKHLMDDWEITVIGINYNGTPHNFPYPIWPARLYGDIWGLGTLNHKLAEINPDAILTVQDPWIAARYATEVQRGDIPFAAYMPIDAKNQNPVVCRNLNKLDLALFYTTFGEIEIRLPGYKGRSHVIPHGVDREIYRPIPQEECRAKLRIFEDGEKETEIPKNAFIIGNVNRNQPRKRLDLTIQYFAEWLRRVCGDARQRIDNAYLYLHCAQRDNAGWDLLELAHYYGVSNRLILPDAEVVTPSRGLPEEEMPYVYGCFDLQVSTAAGEGWGLPQMEGMACGIPQIVPQYAALAEWASGAAYMIPCSDEKTVHPIINTIGAIPEKEAFIRALDALYRNPELRKKYADKALACAREPQFQWKKVSDLFNRYLAEMVTDARARVDKRETEQREKESNEISKKAAEPVAATA